MKFDRAQLDAVGELTNVAFGRALAAMSDPLRLRFVRREGVCDVYDDAMLRLTLTQQIGNSGDVVLCALSGQFSGVAAVVYKKTAAFKIFNVESGRPIDEIPASAEQAAERLRCIGERTLRALAGSLGAQLRSDVDAGDPAVVRCHEAVEAMAAAIPPSISRRLREFVLVSHPMTTDDAAIHGEIVLIADTGGFTSFLRSARLAA